jgi:hypothetical protein
MPLLPNSVTVSYARMRRRKLPAFAEGLIAQPDFFYETMATAGIAPPEFVTDNLKSYPNQKKTAFALFRNTSIPFSWNTMPHEQEVSFPFANKRLLEFCLALPGDMKIRNGWKRYLLRAGMEGILPPEIQWRKTKGPFSPDFFRRVAASRQEVVAALEEMEADTGLYNFVKTYVDLNKMKNYAHSASTCETWADWKGFDPSWQILLRGINIVYFLKWAREKLTSSRKVMR